MARYVGVRELAEILDLPLQNVKDRVKAGDPLLSRGYVGVIGNHRVWDAEVLFGFGGYTDEQWERMASVLTVEAGRASDALTRDDVDEALSRCSIPDCDRAELLGTLCGLHLAVWWVTYRRWLRHGVALERLVALCRWIIERNDFVEQQTDEEREARELAEYMWESVECLAPTCSVHRPRTSPLCKRCMASLSMLVERGATINHTDLPWVRGFDSNA